MPASRLINLVAASALVALGTGGTGNADDLDSGLAGAMSVYGTFDEATLCANVPVACTIDQNLIRLSYWQQHGDVIGFSRSRISYKPFAQCREWVLTAHIEPYCGAVEGESVLQGSASGEVLLTGEMWDGKACKAFRRRFALEGTWAARLEGTLAKGVLDVEMVGEDIMATETSSVPFSLDIMPTSERMRTLRDCPADIPACAPDSPFGNPVFGRQDSAQYSSICGSRG